MYKPEHTTIESVGFAESKKARAVVIKFGGSFATNPETGKVIEEYFHAFFQEFGEALKARYDKIGFVIGGGPKVRSNQRAAQNASAAEKDRLAQQDMWDNAEIIRRLAGEYGLDVALFVPKNPEEAKALAHDTERNTGVVSWLQEHQTSDTSAVILLHLFSEALEKSHDPKDIEAMAVILSNVPFIFTADPKKDFNAKPISYAGLSQLVDANILSARKEDLEGGMSTPIDPVATRLLLDLEQMGHDTTIYFADGRTDNFSSIREILTGAPFDESKPRLGTRIRSNATEILYYEKIEE